MPSLAIVVPCAARRLLPPATPIRVLVAQANEPTGTPDEDYVSAGIRNVKRAPFPA